MGRQKGESARTKARPSSNSLAASLLPAGGLSVGFGGYVGSSRLDPSTTSTSDSPSTVLEVDGELEPHLKRLSRKDPTTKLKALTTLSTQLSEKSAKEVSLLIPQWAFEYKKLLQDYNRDIRRATHDTMATLVSTAGCHIEHFYLLFSKFLLVAFFCLPKLRRRDLAPHLKSLMGPWWFSQFDPVYEVSQAAKRSLQAAFPAQDKRLDALMLCTDEVFMYLGENLKLTPQSMSEKAVALDELQEMHQQVISSSLLALATLLDILTSDKHGSENLSSESKHALKAKTTAISHAEKLLSAHKCFVDFLKSNNSAIRSAAYTLVRSCVENIPHAFDEANIKILAPAILGAFQEKDPTCHSSMWEAVLLFSKRFPESWKSLNVHKIILNRFWSFLRNGCFGSQQVSYPALVLFLDCVPPKAITIEKFFLEFFQNLWAGKVHSQSSNADQLAFFQSYRECFLWALQNAQRFCEGVEAIHHFRRTVVDEVLLKLLWRDYILGPSSASNGKMGPEENIKKSDIKYQTDHVQEFGKCISEILSGIFSVEPSLLSVFCSTFEKTCLDAFQQSENIVSRENLEKIIRFLSSVDLHVVRKGDTWPFFCLVGPMLSKSFQLMQTIDSLNGIKFMVVAVSMFGPLKFIQEVVRGQIEPSSQSEEKNQDLNTRQFLKYYKDTFVPWCLQANSCSSMARLDLLLSLLNEECFSEQLDSIILHATGTRDSNSTCMLAVLMEKLREESIKKKLDMRHWHHERLDSTVLSIARSLPPFGSSDARFVRKDLIFILAAIGGITEDQINLVSENTSVLVFEEIFYKLLSFIGKSNFTWVRGANAILNSEEHITIDGCESSSVLEMANFALEVLDGSLYRLNTLTNNPSLLPRVLAALFMIDWEHSTLAVLDHESNNEAYAEVMDRANFCRSVYSFRRKNNKFIIALSQDSRRTLRNIMVQAIRCVVFSEDKLEIDEAASLASIYAMDVLDSLCLGPVEEQTMFDELLNKGDSWPFWVVPDINDGQRSATLNVKTTSIDTGVVPNVGCLVDKLNISKLGIGRVIAGIPSAHEDPSKKVSTSCSYYPRVWLAAEMLCTWKWQGGSAINSFLPSFIEYTRKQDSSSSDNLLDPVVKVLLDSALVQGAASKMIFSSIYPALHDELESIEEVFLRALVGVLRTLFEDNIWGRDKALVIFNLLVDRLFVGEAVNSNCLKIFPVVMCALISPLSCRVDDSGDEKPNSSEENQIHEGWLQRVLSFPPLNTWNSGEDIEDWFQLIVSCYPFRPTKRMQQFKPQRHISHLEHAHLLELLRKQRLGPTTINKLPIVQTLLSKLTVIVVGYCWTDLNQEDCDFILYNTRRWIGSTVVLMEDVAESVNDTVTSGATSDIQETLQHTLSAIDSSPFKLAINALICFSLFCGLVRQETVKSENGNENEKHLNLLRSEKWEFVTEKIQEGVLRLLFSTGATEAIAGSYSSMASSIISSSRIDECYFWELVASSAVKSSSIVRERAIISFEIWGLSKGAVSSLYAILFSSKPVACLQYAAYVILSSESISESAFVTEQTSSSLRENDIDGNNSFVLKEEISAFLNKSPEEVLYLDLVAPDRVNVFVAWSLLISHLVSSPSSSPTKQKLIQHIQQLSRSSILDCIFQHIPLELYAQLFELPTGVSEIAEAATRAITDNSVLFAVESLWPIGLDGMASFAGAMYGLMLRTLPAYVREWFNDVRDRSSSSEIESFTRQWCSPPLITNELDQIKNANLSDENFSVSVRKSVNEVVATYAKEETGMHLVVRLPLCYSLKPVDVECTRSLGISDVKQRKWLLSMISFIRNQNGALAEAIRIWKNNIDKEFEGVEECPICYSVRHTTYHTRPKLA
ncbi:E3 ubiquitin protein ligase listerin, partial [Tanacetum coccineum]